MRTWEQLVGYSDTALGAVDVAEVNLACAAGLPGAEGLDVPACLQTLDSWAASVRLETALLQWQFDQAPSAFEESWAYFRVLVMVTVLQRDLGVRYNPSLIDRADFFRDSRNLFLHGVIASREGTCTSLPPLYVAIGRRLGYPLRLVSTRCHLFARWEEPDGERFNIECTSLGLNCYPDEHYLDWPIPRTEDDLDSPTFLRSKMPREELAEFLAARGHCSLDNERYRDAVPIYAWASRLDPDNPLRRLAVQDAFDRWDRRLQELRPPHFPEFSVSSSPGRPPAVPPALEMEFVCRQALEDLLTDPVHDRTWWEPMRRSPGRRPAGVPSRVIVRYPQAAGTAGGALIQA